MAMLFLTVSRKMPRRRRHICFLMIPTEAVCPLANFVVSTGEFVVCERNINPESLHESGLS